jgi:hypothetical protein
VACYPSQSQRRAALVARRHFWEPVFSEKEQGNPRESCSLLFWLEGIHQGRGVLLPDPWLCLSVPL